MLEADRLLAEIIDQADPEHPRADSYHMNTQYVQTVGGTWVNERFERNDFTLTRHSKYTDEYQIKSHYLLRLYNANEQAEEYQFHDKLFDNSPDNLRKLTPEQLKSRQIIYEMLSRIELKYSTDPFHATFEQIVARSAAAEVTRSPSYKDVLMDWTPAEWDRAVSARERMKRDHVQWRINPVLLAHGAFNAVYQAQLEKAPSSDHTRTDAILDT